MDLTGGAFDTLHKLYFMGAQDDGDLPSKSGMAQLISLGYAKKDYDLVKPNIITRLGVDAYDNQLEKPF